MSPTDRARLLITGATGLLGQTLVPALEFRFDCIPVGHTHRFPHPAAIRLDLRDAHAVFDACEAIAPNIVVHLAALTNVDVCEEAPSHAYALNVLSTRNLVAWTAKQPNNPHFIYVSTDQLYDSPGSNSEQTANPVNVYGLTKLWAEDIVRSLPDSAVLRLNFFALPTERREGYVGWLLSALSSGKAITAFQDVSFSPLFAARFPEILERVIQRRVRGVHNVGSRDAVTKADFAFRLARTLGLDASNIARGHVADARLKARRPRGMAMDVSSIENALNMKMPTIDQGIAELAMAWVAGQRSATTILSGVGNGSRF